MLLPADQEATLLVIGLALSRYRSVRISQVPSVDSLRFSENVAVAMMGGGNGVTMMVIMVVEV
ncbi:hypothetical protein F8388_013786 [Cannabis sativa]|uniref:Uncharacterized protein n=1 Tax=Cannabis sativa TaxID=3483 RepID=A0A7J6E5E0_CANSA|nr:hypothetical protein F8388_013786 [Cannabis sativa]KAF4390351.1 hypothetical protein G4B88_024357 [Cannabis sativa]